MKNGSSPSKPLMKLHVAGRLVAHARHLTLRVLATWPLATTLARALVRLRTLLPASG
jgi:hypothetical protein